MSTCDGHNHALVEIQRVSEGFDIYRVVRWCQVCGAVVIDGEHDGRVAPGRIMPMRFPARSRTTD